MTLQIIASIVLTFFLLKVWNQYARRNLSFFSSVLWTMLWLSVGVIFWQPEIASRLADFFGVGRGADLIVYVAIVVLSYVAFRIFVKIDKLDRQISTIVKEIALKDEKESSDTDR